MGCKTHVIYICRWLTILRHGYRTVPEAEIIHSVRTLRHSKERLAVRSLNTYYEDILSVPLDGAGIESRMDFEALHKIRIGLLIEVITPEKWGVRSGKDRVRIAFVDAVPFYRFILFRDEGFMLCLQPLQSFIECHILLLLNLYNTIISSSSAKALKSSADSCPGKGA